VGKSNFKTLSTTLHWWTSDLKWICIFRHTWPCNILNQTFSDKSINHAWRSNILFRLISHTLSLQNYVTWYSLVITLNRHNVFCNCITLYVIQCFEIIWFFLMCKQKKWTWKNFLQAFFTLWSCHALMIPCINTKHCLPWNTIWLTVTCLPVALLVNELPATRHHG
jgi:hypothetical protein